MFKYEFYYQTVSLNFAASFSLCVPFIKKEKKTTN